VLYLSLSSAALPYTQLYSDGSCTFLETHACRVSASCSAHAAMRDHAQAATVTRACQQSDGAEATTSRGEAKLREQQPELSPSPRHRFRRRAGCARRPSSAACPLLLLMLLHACSWTWAVPLKDFESVPNTLRDGWLGMWQTQARGCSRQQRTPVHRMALRMALRLPKQVAVMLRQFKEARGGYPVHVYMQGDRCVVGSGACAPTQMVHAVTACSRPRPQLHGPRDFAHRACAVRKTLPHAPRAAAVQCANKRTSCARSSSLASWAAAGP
jgi:hypothetical protein